MESRKRRFFCEKYGFLHTPQIQKVHVPLHADAFAVPVGMSQPSTTEYKLRIFLWYKQQLWCASNHLHGRVNFQSLTCVSFPDPRAQDRVRDTCGLSKAASPGVEVRSTHFWLHQACDSCMLLTSECIINSIFSHLLITFDIPGFGTQRQCSRGRPSCRAPDHAVSLYGEETTTPCAVRPLTV